MKDEKGTFRGTVSQELILLATLVSLALLILPLVVFLVGQTIFGDYGGAYGARGLLHFYAQLLQDFLRGEPVIWFLMLSPYLVWQIVRIAAICFRRGKQEA